MAKFHKDPSKHSLISLFNNNCKYLDDISTVNISNFLTFVKQIYPKELTLNEINISDSCQFLDLEIPLFKVNLANAHTTKEINCFILIVNFPFMAFTLFSYFVLDVFVIVFLTSITVIPR